MTRNAIYICADNDRVFALCDDGTIWTMDVVELKLPELEWEHLPDIPQPKEKQ